MRLVSRQKNVQMCNAGGLRKTPVATTRNRVGREVFSGGVSWTAASGWAYLASGVQLLDLGHVEPSANF